MDTIFIQPIFAPDKKRFDRNWESLTSFLKYCEKYNYDVKFAVGGWCLDEYWDKFVELINKSYMKNKITLLRFEKNYGKAIVVNSLYKKVKESNVSFKYMLTCDSDILFPDYTEHLIDRLEQLAKESVVHTKKPFGMVSLNQMGANCHWKVCYENQYVYTNKFNNVEKIVYPNHPGGIAGGCLFLSRDCWEKVGGYRQLGVYAGDDAYMLLDTNANGFSYQMSDTISIIHPTEDDEEYAKWKLMVCQRDSYGGISKQNYDNIIEEAGNFWKNRK
jgi:hypothetical protein